MALTRHLPPALSPGRSISLVYSGPRGSGGSALLLIICNFTATGHQEGTLLWGCLDLVDRGLKVSLGVQGSCGGTTLAKEAHTPQWFLVYLFLVSSGTTAKELDRHNS